MDEPTLAGLPTIGPVAHTRRNASAEIGGGEHDDHVAVRWARRPWGLATPTALLGLCLLALAFFWRVIVLRQVLLPADVLYAHDPLWRSLATHPFAGPANPLDSDALTEFYPWTALAAGAIHRGVLPLWNPYAFAGTPFLAAMQPAVLYPVNLALEWLLPPTGVLGARAIVHLAITLVGTFCFARSIGLSRSAGLLAALAFGLGLPYVVWLEHPMSGAVAWLPWLLLGIERLTTTRGSLRWTVVTAALVALEVLAGHGESTAHVLLLCAAYAFFHLGLVWRRRGGPAAAARALVALVLAPLLGVGLAAAHLLPTLMALPASEAAADRTRAALAAPVGPWGDPARWKSLVVAVAPDFFGNPTWHAVLPGTPGYNESALYVGGVALFLALLALLHLRVAPVHRPRRIFFAASAVVALGLALHFPLLGLLDNAPVLRLMANGRLRVEYAFAVAILAGYGLDLLPVVGMGRTVWPLARLWALTVYLVAALALALLIARHVVPAVAWRAAVPALWCTVVVAVVWLHRRGVVPARLLPWPILAVAAVELFALGSGYHTTLPTARVTAVPPAVRAVTRDRSLYRVAGLGAALLPSLSSLYGLQDIRGYDPAYAEAYERYFTASFATPGGMRLGLAPFGPSPAMARALDLLNVKYVFASCAVRLNARFYRPVYRGAGCVYRNAAVIPRAILVHRAAWSTPARAAALLAGGVVDPRSTVLLDPASTRGAGWTVPRASASSVAARDTVDVTHYDLDRIDLHVGSDAGGVLVVSDAYAPGWHAQVDGRPAPVIRADAVFRAVRLGPGVHEINLVYAPETVTIGAAISLAALALWCVLLLLALRHALVAPGAGRMRMGALERSAL